MPMKFKGGSPKNARIKIDYSGVKPNVTFSYPDKKHQTSGTMFFYIVLFFMIIGMSYYSYIDNSTLSSYQMIGIILVLPLIATCLVYYPFKKQWANVYPNFFAALAHNKKYRKFLPKDVQKNKYCYVEIPLFKNTLLDYKATKDFSKHLEFFEIREHKFKYVKWNEIKREIRKKLTKKQKKRKKMRELNDTLWYAKFYFTKKPKNGQLEVLFK